MSILPLEKVSAIQFLEEKQTQGSGPLLVIATDDQAYIAKTCTQTVPRIELINEVLCGYMLRCWQLSVPYFKLIDIDFSLVEDKVSIRYNRSDFNTPFFASLLIEPTIDLEGFTRVLSANELKKFIQPSDFLKIGCFDLWVGNKDRKPTNMNLLLSQVNKKLAIHPIDHTAAFAYCTHYNQVSDAWLYLEPSHSILKTGIVQSVFHQFNQQFLENLKADIDISIQHTLDNLEAIYQQIPAEWGFSKKAKLHLKEFLASKSRNSQILGRFNAFLK
ncbi:MAG: HipA family kinase [Bacteroidota bacterium]